MNTNKKFNVLGETVEVLVSSESTQNAFCVVLQTSRPGGGPPPHLHANEDEFFVVVEGEYEIFDGEHWHKLRQGEYMHAPKGKVHTFRNSGSTAGKILGMASPGGLDEYLEAISPISIPRDLHRLTEISDGYGIRFAGAEVPAK